MIYRSGDRLAPRNIRKRRFTTRWRGADPDEVSAYLIDVANEIARLEREVVAARAEHERLKEGLRQWRARHVGCRFNDPEWARNSRWSR